MRVRKNRNQHRLACATFLESLERRLLLSASPTVTLPLVAGSAVPDISGTPEGLSPSMIERAYDLSGITFASNGQTIAANGAGETIAIVDAYSDPNIVSDLQTFD